MYKKALMFLNNPWVIGIAIFVLIIIIANHAISIGNSSSRTFKPEGKNAIKTLLLSQDFESLHDITAAGGEYSVADLNYEDLTLVDGRGDTPNKAVHMPTPLAGDNGTWLTYPVAGNGEGPYFNLQRGTLELWLKPHFDMHIPPTESKQQWLFDVKWGANQRFMLGMAKVPIQEDGHSYWGLTVTIPGLSVNSVEPSLFCKNLRYNVYSRVRVYWDLSLPETDGFSVNYDGPGTAYISVTSGYPNQMRVRTTGAPKNIDTKISYLYGHYNLGQIVGAINGLRLPGDSNQYFHATLLGSPDAQGFMKVRSEVTLPTQAPGITFQQLNSYMLFQANDTYSRVEWVPKLTPAELVGDEKIYVGCRLGKFYPARADIDSLKIWNSVELPVIPFPQHFANPYYRETITLYDSIFANDGFCGDHETYGTQPTDCPILDASIAPGESVLPFERSAFEIVLSNYVPTADEIKNTFSYKIPPGEIETVFFNIYSRIALTNMKLKYTALTGPGIIAKNKLDLRVIHNWFQANFDYNTSAEPLPVFVPELMLHCDVFPKTIGARTQINPQLDRTLGQFKIPTLLKLDYVHTKMAAFTAKQFGLIVEVPADTPPGEYTGTVTVTADELAEPLILTLNFTVLPFTLRDSGSIGLPWYSLDSIWYFARPDKMNLPFWDIYKQVMVEMVRHGIYGAQHCSMNDYDAGHTGDTTQGMAYAISGGTMTYQQFIEKKLQLAKEAGMKMFVLYAGFRPATRDLEYTPEIVAAMKARGFVPWMFGQDEFRVPGNVDNQTAISARVKEIGGKIITNTIHHYVKLLDNGYTTTTLSPNVTYTPEQTRLDGVSYIASEPFLHELIGGRKAITREHETTYFQTRTPYPNFERYWCGYYIYWSSLHGPQPTWFMAFPVCYGDFNYTKNRPAWFGNYGVAYHAVDQKGNHHIIPTLHGCSMREGFKDHKYITTWKYYRDKLAASYPVEVAKSQAKVDAILVRYKEEYGHVVTPAMRNSATQFATDREAIIGEIITLKKLHDGRNLVGGAIPKK